MLLGILTIILSVVVGIFTGILLIILLCKLFGDELVGIAVPIGTLVGLLIIRGGILLGGSLY